MVYRQTGTEYSRSANVNDPAAITSVVAAGTAPTKAEYDALRSDVIALRTTVADLLVSLRNSNTIG